MKFYEHYGSGFTDEEIKEFEAEALVKKTDNIDDLVHLVVEEIHHPAARQCAAEKILRMWKAGHHTVTLQHLVYVGDHAEEPEKSKANKIIHSHI